MYRKVTFVLAALCALAINRRSSSEATWFTMNIAAGACADSNPVLPEGVYGTALSTQNWDNGAHCGQQMTVHGPNGNTIQAMVIDRCMGCILNGLDLDEPAFAQLASVDVGRIDVTWDWN